MYIHKCIYCIYIYIYMNIDIYNMYRYVYIYICIHIIYTLYRSAISPSISSQATFVELSVPLAARLAEALGLPGAAPLWRDVLSSLKHQKMVIYMGKMNSYPHYSIHIHENYPSYWHLFGYEWDNGETIWLYVYVSIYVYIHMTIEIYVWRANKFNLDIHDTYNIYA